MSAATIGQGRPPDGLEVRTDPLRLVNARGRTIAEPGDVVRFAGGSGAGNQSLPPGSCHVGDEVAVLNEFLARACPRASSRARSRRRATAAKDARVPAWAHVASGGHDSPALRRVAVGAWDARDRTHPMEVRFIAGFAVITTDVASGRRLYAETFGLPLSPPVSVSDSECLCTEDVPGAKHFGVWPLEEAAQACFGRPTWPDSHPATGHDRVRGRRRRGGGAGAHRGWPPVGSSDADGTMGTDRGSFQTAEGLLVGLCVTPWLREG